MNMRPGKLFENFLSKSFGSSKISLTFASAFRKKAVKKSSLKDLDINKQVVQKAYLGKKTETVNNLNKLMIDLVLEQIIQLARVKRIFLQ